MVYTYVPRSMPDKSNAWNHPQSIPAERRKFVHRDEYTDQQFYNQADHHRKRALAGIKSFEQALTGTAASHSPSVLASSLRSKSSSRSMSQRHHGEGSTSLLYVASASSDQPENPQGDVLQNIKRARSIQRMDDFDQQQQPQQHHGDASLPRISALSLPYEGHSPSHSNAGHSLHLSATGPSAQYSPPGRAPSVSNSFHRSEGQSFDAMSLRSTMTVAYHKALVPGPLDFYSRPDLDRQAALEVSKRILTELQEDEMRSMYLQSKRMEQISKLEQRKEQRRELWKRCWKSNHSSAAPADYSGMHPFSETGSVMEMDHNADDAERDSRSHSFRQNPEAKKAEATGVLDAAEEDDVFGPEAYAKFRQQVFREAELTRMNERMDRREQMEAYCGTMYYRKQVKEERKRLKEAVRQQKLEDQLPEHEKAALAELQHFDEKLNASVKQERKAMQSIVRKPKFK